MYSEALQIMDRNTERYMVDELKSQLARQKAENDAVISKKDAVISEKDATISQLIAENQRLRESQKHHSTSDQ